MRKFGNAYSFSENGCSGNVVAWVTRSAPGIFLNLICSSGFARASLKALL